MMVITHAHHLLERCYAGAGGTIDAVDSDDEYVPPGAGGSRRRGGGGGGHGRAAAAAARVQMAATVSAYDADTASEDE